MHIRKLTSDDSKILQQCRLFGLSESPDSFLVSLSEVKGTPVTLVQAELENPNIHYLGAFIDDQLIGFMRYVRPERQSKRHTAEVRSVYVKKSARGQGVGSKLLSQLVQDARTAGIESLNLSVLSNNVPARALYESFGFTVYGTEPKAIKKHDQYIDQTHYWLSLTN